MSKYEHLRREMRASFELTWDGQADANKRICSIATKLDQQAEKIAEQGQQIAESMRDSARIGREVVAIGDQTVGLLRQMDQRFAQFLDVLEGDSREQSDAISDLQQRVARLESLQGPAA
jgi:uncharacterized caspase-like protein